MTSDTRLKSFFIKFQTFFIASVTTEVPDTVQEKIFLRQAINNSL